MLAAVAADFGRLPGVSVATIVDARLRTALSGVETVMVDNPEAAIEQFDIELALADYCLIVAPETEGELLGWVRRAEDRGVRLLGPAADWTALAADKQTACRLLAAAGVPVVEGISLPAGTGLPLDFPYPAVLKRRDGAGSCDARQIDSTQAAERHPPLEFAARLEPLWPGRPASVALLLGAAGMFPLAPCWQKLAEDGSFAYLGGEIISEKPLANRAARLAERAVAALGPARGYVGVDLLLGGDASEDVIVEINPRLTTSYVGLRAAYDQNLAQAWLAVIEGNRPDIEAARSVAFRSDGVIFQPQAATP